MLTSWQQQLENFFLKDQNSPKKKKKIEYWKLGAIYFCTVKTYFSSFHKLGAGGGGQPNNISFFFFFFF